MKHEILQYIAKSYGERLEADGSTGESADWSKILDSLGEGEKVELDDSPTTDQPEIDETDSGIVKLVNQLIIEAYARGASDFHIEPEGPRLPCGIRLRIDGDCQKFMEVPGAHRNALVQRLKIMAKLDISEKRKPQDGKIRLRTLMQDAIEKAFKGVTDIKQGAGDCSEVTKSR